MKKELLIQFVAMVVALAVAATLAPILQKQQRVINPDKDRLTTAPVGGMHKVISDWEWMKFINYLGKLQVVDDTNVKEVTERLERLVGLDPKYERLYLDGISSIQHADPKKTMEILEKACSLDYLKDNWKIPFYTGFVYSRDTYDIKDQNGPPLLAANHAKAAQYFRMAIERSGGTPENHLVNSYIRELAKAEAVGTAPDREYLAKLRILYREWRKMNVMGQNGQPPGTPDETVSSPESSVTLIPNVQERLLKAIQEAKNPLDVYDHRFEPGKEVLALIEQIKKDVLSGQNLCQKCLYPAAFGDKFCTHCGSKLDHVRGICKFCGVKLKEGSAFCPECGKSSKEPEPAPKPVTVDSVPAPPRAQ